MSSQESEFYENVPESSQPNQPGGNIDSPSNPYRFRRVGLDWITPELLSVRNEDPSGLIAVRGIEGYVIERRPIVQDGDQPTTR